MLQSYISTEIGWFYPWLRKLSGKLIASEYRGKTLQPTALANEIILKLLRWNGELDGEKERSLRILATTIAKQTLIDLGRRRSHREGYLRSCRESQNCSDTRGSNSDVQSRVQSVLAAIEQLETSDVDLARLVRLRFFEGYSLVEATEILGMSQRTAARRWSFAKAYLADALREKP